MKRFIFMLCCVFLLTMPMMAQKYILDDNFEDSISLYQIVPNKDGVTESLGSVVKNVPIGEEVMLKRVLKNNSDKGLVVYEGKEYAVYSTYLLFSDDNPEGVEDVFGDTRERAKHTWAGKFFATLFPYLLIAVLFIVAIVFMFLGSVSNLVRPLSIMVVPACIFLGSALEIWAFWTLGDNALWWCSTRRMGFFGSLLCCIPYVCFVLFQLYSIKGYERLLIGDEHEEGLSIKPMAISVAICIPVTIIVLIILNVLGIKDPWEDIISIVALLLSFGIGVMRSHRKNVKILGNRNGLFFTLFGIVYCFAAVVAVYGLVMILIELIIQILMVIGAIVGVFYILGSTSLGSSSGGSNNNWRSRIGQKRDGTWSNGDGKSYESRSQAEFHANKN